MKRLLATSVLVALVTLPGNPANGHAGDTHGSPWLMWSTDLSVLVPLSLAAGFYALGLWQLWRRAGVGRGISRAKALSFTAGVLVLVVALVSPLDALTSTLFSVHMVQHLLLILVAPPLLVVGAPDVALLWALPRRWRAGYARFERRVSRFFSSTPNSEGFGKGPLIIALLSTGALWLWHLPRLYDLAVRSELVHWVEHMTFLITALLFWACILRLRPRDHVGNGLRILYVFGIALQGSLLGALITFAAQPLYESHLDAARFGLTPLVDQQIAGLIMWVPPAVLYIAVSAYLFVKWLEAVAARDRARRMTASRASAAHAASVLPKEVNR